MYQTWVRHVWSPVETTQPHVRANQCRTSDREPSNSSAGGEKLKKRMNTEDAAGLKKKKLSVTHRRIDIGQPIEPIGKEWTPPPKAARKADAKAAVKGDVQEKGEDIN